MSMATTLATAGALRFSISDRPRHPSGDAGGHAAGGARLLAAVPARRHPDQFGEAGAEGAERGAADLEADLGDAEVAAPQQRHRPLDPARHQVAVGGLAEGLAELAAEVAGRHMRPRGERLDVQRLRVLAVDPVAHAPQADELIEPLP